MSDRVLLGFGDIVVAASLRLPSDLLTSGADTHCSTFIHCGDIYCLLPVRDGRLIQGRERGDSSQMRGRLIQWRKRETEQ